MGAAPLNPEVALHVRSYGVDTGADRHPYAQLVLPLEGSVELDIGGRQGRADPLHGAVVPPQAWHGQQARVANRSLIVDIDAAGFEQGPWAGLLARPFVALDPAARKLVEYMGIVAMRGPGAATLQGWTALLLDALAGAEAQPRSRLAALLARIEAAPGRPWSVEAMADAVGVSTSRLHALFREEQGASPHAWLQRQRLASACAWLAQTDRPLAEIALAPGFSDQSALTRAMRAALDVTPAAYRRARRARHLGRAPGG